MTSAAEAGARAASAAPFRTTRRMALTVPMDIAIAETCDLGVARLAALRRLMQCAFHDFSGFHWEHASGGLHILGSREGAIVAHAAIVPRRIEFAGLGHSVGYVEAMAIAPAWQRRGHGTQILATVGEVIDQHYEIGVLSTGSPAFYARSGWTVWRGPSFVRGKHGLARSRDDDGGIMVRAGPILAHISRKADIVCEARSGDAW